MKEYPFLSKFLRQGVINYRALAREIEPEISRNATQKVSISSIAVSLQRLHQRDKSKMHSLIGRLRGVVVVSDVHSLTTSSDPRIYQIANKVINENTTVHDPFCIILRGNSETTCLVEKALVKKFTEMLGANNVQDNGGLVALIVTREITHPTEVGGLSYPVHVLAEHGILTQSIVATQHEEIIIVDDAVADQAATVLRKAMER